MEQYAGMGLPMDPERFCPDPVASPIINGGLAQDVAGLGGFAMWDNHLYLDAAIYRSEHVGGPQPNPGDGSTNNIRGVAPYWRVAFQQLTAKTQYEIGTYGIHVRNAALSGPGPQDEYTDFAFDTQIDRTLFRTDVLSFRGTYIRENSNLLASGLWLESSEHGAWRMPNTISAIATPEHSAYSILAALSIRGCTLAAAVSGSANGDPRGAGYIANVSYWPWQNLQLGAQYTGYTRFNGGSTNYDGSGRNASSNNTFYLDAKFIF